MVWEKAFDVIEPSIRENGFYRWDDSWTSFVKKYGIDASQPAPVYLSRDFYSLQRSELVERGLYVIRLGLGNFGIFDQKVFPKPYLKLDEKDAESIGIERGSDYSALRKAFMIEDENLNSAENSLLELCRFYGIFKTILGFYGEERYEVGPRGFYSANFPLLFKRRGGVDLELVYDGQVELDYSIWTENRVLVFEAKSVTRGGLDIGWHKLAYPAQRFSGIGPSLKINPVYFLRKSDRDGNRILIYLFPELHFIQGGVVLNDESCWRPLKTWVVDLDQLSGSV
jgi:hypothetical protein